MTPSEIFPALGRLLGLNPSPRWDDTLADLASAAFPEVRWSAAEGLGWGDPWPMIRGDVAKLLRVLDVAGSKNAPPAEVFREAARAVRACVDRIEASE